MTVFIEVVLPVLVIFLIGYVIQKRQQLDIRSLSAVAIYVFTPMLVFDTFYQTTFDAEYIDIVLFTIILTAALIILTKLYTWWRKRSIREENGLILSVAFMNSGNYGAPILLFAYGEQAFIYAVSILVLHAIIMNFLGVYYAAKGKEGISYAFRAVFSMPPTYAVILALVFKGLQIELPEYALSAIHLLGSATIPLVMIILGMQLAMIRLTKVDVPLVRFGVVVRLFISPLLAMGILTFFDLNETLYKVLVVTAAMPSAATTVLYAIQYDTEAELVSAITLLTTIGSVFTLSALLLILQ